MQQAFNILLIVMAVLAVVVFIALFFVDAGYGMLLNRKWGKTVSNKVGWFVMESPVFLLMTVLWLMSDRRFEAAPLCFLFLFQLHYFQRAFIFPFLLKGRGRMPLAIIAMGILFNMVNAVMQGGWIFYLAPEGSIRLLGSKPRSSSSGRPFSSPAWSSTYTPTISSGTSAAPAIRLTISLTAECSAG